MVFFFRGTLGVKPPIWCPFFRGTLGGEVSPLASALLNKSLEFCGAKLLKTCEGLTALSKSYTAPLSGGYPRNTPKNCKKWAFFRQNRLKTNILYEQHPPLLFLLSFLRFFPYGVGANRSLFGRNSRFPASGACLSHDIKS